jgi:hypothetical protein
LLLGGDIVLLSDILIVEQLDSQFIRNGKYWLRAILIRCQTVADTLLTHQQHSKGLAA